MKLRTFACVMLAFSCLTWVASVWAAPAQSLRLESVLAVDAVGETGLSPASDVLSVSLYRDLATEAPVLRVSFLSLDTRAPGQLAEAFDRHGDQDIVLSLRGGAEKSATTELASCVLTRSGRRIAPATNSLKGPARLWQDPSDQDALYFALPESEFKSNTWHFSFTAAAMGTKAGDDKVTGVFPPTRAYEGHCAMVLHGNQGIGYSDVFHGRSDDLEGSGFDEALQTHEALNIPGNFHMSGTLQTSAEWAARNGDPQDFNAWLANGVTAGWAGMITSAYGQHIMPFVNDDMNDWSVHTQAQMTVTRYGYVPTVAWVPERVWLNTSGYPSSGVNDWIGDNWLDHGVLGVILDDDVHLAGHDNHQIHTLSGNGLRLIPRDRSFTGNIIGGNGQGALDIVSGLAGSGVGEYRIAVFAEDWEAASEMGGWADITPNAKETYDWFIGKCSDESAWLHAWKLDAALTNPNFNGSTITVSPGTYNEIGGTGGYGGADNAWYTHWAGYVPYANGGDGGGCGGGGGNCKNYGTLWNDAYNALMSAPDNNLSQAGWYVLMTNLHETAWHDYMGGDISGWQHKYSAHIKNAMIYAEAARWANGDYIETTNAYFTDIDNDGFDECVVHNDHLYAVIEGVGGRITNLFIKGDGYDDTAIGNDNAYWSGTDGDFNDDNHIGALSDVSPNYQNNHYDIEIVSVTPDAAVLRLSHNEVSRELTLGTGDSFLDITYRVGPANHWWKAGFTPSLIDLVWNSELDRVWASDQAYMGQRNPNTGVAVAWITGSGGASHQRDFSATLMKGDELTGNGTMQMRLFAGPTSVAGGDGEIAELRALANEVTDTLGPQAQSASFNSTSGLLRVTFDQSADPVSVLPASFSLDDDQDGLADVTLDASTIIAEIEASYVLTFELTPADVAAMSALDEAELRLLAAADAVADPGGVGNVAVTVDDDVRVATLTTAVSIDGNIDVDEWSGAEILDDASDSTWGTENEIDRLLVKWDNEYLYVAIDGQVSNNSWLLYLDVDPGSGLGETDLTATDAWERGASFTAADLAVDFQYGCYQHQSPYDGDGFWQLLSATTTQDRSGEIQSAFDSYHTYGTTSGSELAIPWNTLYGLGDGAVPINAQVSLVASITWDPDPDGELGGDSAPSNLSAALPMIDTSWTITIDADGNGIPDGGATPAPLMPNNRARLLPNVPNPFNPSTTFGFDIPGTKSASVSLVIFDVRGRKIATLVQGILAPGRHQAVWSGQSQSGQPMASGTYFCQFRCDGLVSTRPISLVK